LKFLISWTRFKRFYQDARA